ncbi:MAG: ETC complex I subunit [Rhodospirillales bacterium]|nr:ETC complex I subunit [Rhodospirillales bacterium]
MEEKIYQPAKTAMQSGRANTKRWVVEYAQEEAKQADTLMGWIGSGDTRGQVRMRFATREEAIAYAERNQLAYQVKDAKVRKIRPKNYADNFRFDRIE